MAATTLDTSYITAYGFGDLFPGLTFQQMGVANSSWLNAEGQPYASLQSIIEDYNRCNFPVYLQDYALDNLDIPFTSEERRSFAQGTERCTDDQYCLSLPFGYPGQLLPKKQSVLPTKRLRIGWEICGWEDGEIMIGTRFVTNRRTGVMYESF